MNVSRHALMLFGAGIVLAACGGLPGAASDPAPERDVVAALAPTGKLRVGLYPGSPTSIIPAEGTGAARGVGYDLGAELARRLGVPFDPIVFPANERVQEAARANAVDLVFTNATAARAQFIDFTEPVMRLEKGYLVRPGSAERDTAGMDRAGIRIGVTRGSTTIAELGHILKAATVVPQPSFDDAVRALGDGTLDAYASNKAILYEMSGRLPGSRVLPGRWGEETFALGTPKGRDAAALAYLNRFARSQREGGSLRRSADRAGLRGVSE